MVLPARGERSKHAQNPVSRNHRCIRAGVCRPIACAIGAISGRPADMLQQLENWTRPWIDPVAALRISPQRFIATVHLRRTNTTRWSRCRRYGRWYAVLGSFRQKLANRPGYLARQLCGGKRQHRGGTRLRCQRLGWRIPSNRRSAAAFGRAQDRGQPGTWGDQLSPQVKRKTISPLLAPTAGNLICLYGSNQKNAPMRKASR